MWFCSQKEKCMTCIWFDHIFRRVTTILEMPLDCSLFQIIWPCGVLTSSLISYSHAYVWCNLYLLNCKISPLPRKCPPNLGSSRHMGLPVSFSGEGLFKFWNELLKSGNLWKGSLNELKIHSQKKKNELKVEAKLTLEFTHVFLGFTHVCFNWLVLSESSVSDKWIHS